MMPRNSGNSIIPEPSSSTDIIMSITSSLVSAKPKPISGSSNSSIPMAPEPSPSREPKHSFSFLICLRGHNIKIYTVLRILEVKDVSFAMLKQPLSLPFFNQHLLVRNKLLFSLGSGHQIHRFQLLINLYIEYSQFIKVLSYIIQVFHSCSSNLKCCVLRHPGIRPRICSLGLYLKGDSGQRWKGIRPGGHHQHHLNLLFIIIGYLPKNEVCHQVSDCYSFYILL